VKPPAAAGEPGPLTVGEVLALLDERYPLQDAESWDRVGLLVGDPGQPVNHIVCALDPNDETLRRAQQAGADLLVTHHPTYLPPEPGEQPPAYGVVLEKVARDLGSALIACHTNLDVSEEARLSLGAGLPLVSRGPLVTATDEQGQVLPAFAQLWEATAALSATSVAKLLARRFQAPVRLSLAPADAGQLTRVVTATGSGGDALDAAIESGAQLFITGEMKYHQLVEARDRGISCIEVGHDVSEWPLAALLHDTLVGDCTDRGVTVALLPRDLFSQIITEEDPDHG